MASTSSLTRVQRKYTKRQQRRANKTLFASLSAKDRAELKESEKGMKGFLKEKGRL